PGRPRGCVRARHAAARRRAGARLDGGRRPDQFARGALRLHRRGRRVGRSNIRDRRYAGRVRRRQAGRERVLTLRRRVFHLDTGRGKRFALLTSPAASAPIGGLLFLHPFAEEMNKSRRMVALAARAFASAGWAVLQVDLAGCGDSEGDFADADWQTWLDDVSHAWSV